MQKVRRHTFPLRDIVLRPLVSAWFQVLLTQLIAVLFIVQSPYLSTIGHRGIFSLGRWAAGFTRSSTRSVLLWYASRRGPDRVAYGAFTLCGPLSSRFRYDRFCNPSRRPQPRDESRFGLCPRSLAATDGIDVSFCSSRYLDVSVPWVRSRPPIHSAGGNRV